MRALRYTPTKRRATQGERVVWRRPRPRRFRPGGRNDDYSTRQATLHSAGGHRRPSYPRKETFAQPSYPRRRVSSGPKRHSSRQQRIATSTSAHGAVIVAGRVPFSSTSDPVDSGSGAGMTTTLLSGLHSTRQAATDARHTRERRPLHSRHTREGGYSGPKRHSSRQQRLAASTSAHGAVIVAGRMPFSSTSDPVDSGSGAGMTTTLLGRLHSARRAATDARHTRERRPLHNRHTREGGYPAVRRGIRPINSVSPPRCRRPGRSFVAGRGAIQLDLPPRRFRLGGRNDDYSTQQATLHSAGGHRQPSYPRRRVSSGPKGHSSHQLWNRHL